MIGRDDLAWGLVGGLSFLVLLQGYELLGGTRVALAVKVGVALLVTATTAALAPRVRSRIRANGRA